MYLNEKGQQNTTLGMETAISQNQSSVYERLRVWFNYSVERRNWVYGGRRSFWSTALIVAMVLLPLRVTMYGLVYGWVSLELVSALISIALVVSFLLWRWEISRKVFDGHVYQSTVHVLKRIFSTRAGAPDGAHLHTMRASMKRRRTVSP